MGARKTKSSTALDAVGLVPRDKCVVTDLGIIHVETRGNRDVVFLAHNHLRAFALECFEDRPSALTVSEKFYEYTDPQWREVFAAYLQWKRANFPKFRLGAGTGRKRDGSIHPWRAGVTNREQPIRRTTTTHEHDDHDDGTGKEDGTGGSAGNQTAGQGNHPPGGDGIL